jgi:DDE family transposase
MKVTDDENVHDSKVLPELVDKIVKSNKRTGKLLFADDGNYEGNDIFRYLSADNGILPCIKIRKNAKIKLKDGNLIRNLSAISQKKDLQKWKEDSIVSYGQRWIVVETVFHPIKRTFGEYVYLVRLKNMIQ